jgi:pyruvate kinase
MTQLFKHKTKLVCTIGPASDSPEMLEKMIKAGLNVARLNFSHGDFSGHAEVIKKIRAAAKKTGRRVAILADLPGPKMRIGDLEEEYVILVNNERFTLTADRITGDVHRVSMTMKELPAAVKSGDTLFLNDGLIELRVEEIAGNDIHCRVIVGGKLRPRKGLNIPGIDLGISAFTPRDRECMQFALEHGVDAVGQSFVNRAQDVLDVRNAATEMGFDPFIIAKIERASVRDYIDEILEVTDGVMVARGDLGVEIPIEEIAIAQKLITAKANFLGKPVITATQMLESMPSNRRPTRAEATDVANAILDGTDCVMLSEESAMGSYPLEAVKMLAKIARATEPNRWRRHFDFILKPQAEEYSPTPVDLISGSIERVLLNVDSPAAVLAPTYSGFMARSLTRFRLPVWIIAVSTSQKTCRDLMFSYGVHSILEETLPDNWQSRVREYAARHNFTGSCIIKAEGPSPEHPDVNHKMEIISLGDD